MVTRKIATTLWVRLLVRTRWRNDLFPYLQFIHIGLFAAEAERLVEFIGGDTLGTRGQVDIYFLQLRFGIVDQMLHESATQLPSPKGRQDYHVFYMSLASRRIVKYAQRGASHDMRTIHHREEVRRLRPDSPPNHRRRNPDLGIQLAHKYQNLLGLGFGDRL